jgi:catechol 2,3-dioxygenase-like lactoylglutathione lyase family enzyme
MGRASSGEAMIDHVGYAVRNFARSRAFYTAALAPLGLAVVMEGADWAMMGRDGRPEFWFGIAGRPVNYLHLAFRAGSRAEVDAFWKAALGAGGTDNGAPGLRPHYHPDYYGAFVLDPDGLNIEAVTHAPP